MSCEVHLRGLHVAVGEEVLIEEANAHFAAGGLHAVVGRSGAGKSVLMKAACGLLPAARGEVLLKNGEGDTLRAAAGDAGAFKRARERMVFVHQDPALLDDITVLENVAFGVLRRASAAVAKERVRYWVRELSLNEVANKMPRELSPGGQRRAALARALCLRPEVLIVDEPTTGLDPQARHVLWDRLYQLKERGATLVLTTHYMECI